MGKQKWRVSNQQKRNRWEMSQGERAGSKRQSLGDWDREVKRWKERTQKRKRGRSNRKSQVRWRLWLRGWLQISTEGFPSCCLQLADHTLRGWGRELEDKYLTSLSFALNPLFSLPVCLRLSLKGLRLTCWPILSFPAPAGHLLHLSLPSPLSFHPSLNYSHHPSVLSSHFTGSVIWDSLVCPCNTTAQICSVSLCISYLLCLTSRDKPVFITLSDLFSKSVLTHGTHTHLQVAERPPTNLNLKSKFQLLLGRSTREEVQI